MGSVNRTVNYHSTVSLQGRSFQLQSWRATVTAGLTPFLEGIFKPADTVALLDWRLELNLQTLWPSRTGVKPVDTVALQDWRLELNQQTLCPSRTGVKPTDTAALQNWRLKINLQTLRPSRTGVKPADTAALQDWRLELNLQTLWPSRTGVKPADIVALQDWRLEFETTALETLVPPLVILGTCGLPESVVRGVQPYITASCKSQPGVTTYPTSLSPPF
ncbi:hypothetical protein JZ751_005567 [Albula glossodonta]|uniref:Uncharacterized protein n=1 Tax=Albula glossodonta TaxID=121402 RepID=A0A8T2NC01_9TELE|nr:hypothetical protein JZ751_005567 [Albula glossodonta]